MKNFIHLHVHGEYSLQDAIVKHKDLILAASENNMGAVALTDHGAMFGLVDFYKQATSKFKDKGIKPILGCETYVAPRENTFKDSKLGDNANHHLVLLCENNKGYENLVQIISDAAVNGFYYKARTDKKKLKKWHEGLIALSACLGGEVSWKLLNESYENGKKAALEYDAIFGRGNFFLEIQDHGMPEQHQVNEMLIRLSRETGIPLVATNDVHYIKQEGAQPHDVLMAIQAGVTVHDEKRKRYPTDKFYFRSASEMWEIFGSVAPEALENTVRIAERCNVTIEFGKYKIPKFDVPLPWNNNEEFLKHLTTEGVKRRYTPIISRLMNQMKIDTENEMWDIIYKRLDYEVSVISKMGYCDYFLIVWDFLRYYREELDGPWSPARGSAAGCMAAYTLDITHVEPLENGLLFERFLSPNRVSMPDIDVDMSVELRQVVIDYVSKKYGQDRVCQIITFGTYAARAAIRAVGRALDVPYIIADKVAKMVPLEVKITIDDALIKNKDMKAYYDSDAQVKQLIDYALAIEGLPSNTSTHAAGVLICPETVTNFVPVWVNDGVVVAQFNMVELEELGLLKMDFLGLRNLTVIGQTLDSIEKNHGVKIAYDDLLKTIDDPDSFIMIQKGMTIGVFQLEGSGMTNFMTDFKPNSFAEVIAGISIYRPGPMEYIPRYLHNRANPQDIRYLHPKLEKILKETNGVIVYQEQCMFTAVDLAGYSQADADDFRRAISKKKQEAIDKHKGWFIYGREEGGKILVPGCIRNGIDEEIAKQIFGEMEEFAKYALT